MLLILYILSSLEMIRTIATIFNLQVILYALPLNVLIVKNYYLGFDSVPLLRKFESEKNDFGAEKHETNLSRVIFCNFTQLNRSIRVCSPKVKTETKRRTKTGKTLSSTIHSIGRVNTQPLLNYYLNAPPLDVRSSS